MSAIAHELHVQTTCQECGTVARWTSTRVDSRTRQIIAHVA